MNIWMLNHYAGHPSTVPATRTYDVARHLASAGHSVTIVACAFNHYTFRDEQFRGSGIVRRQRVDGIEIVWIRAPGYQRNGWRRLANMLAYALVATIVGATSRRRPDLVIGTTVHPFAPMAALAVSRLRRARFWVDITDIWPASLVDLGHVRASALSARVFGWCERFTLKRAELVTSVVPNIQAYVRDMGLTTPTLWTPNGFDPSRRPVARAAVPRRDEFVVMWAGGFAPAHALEVVLEAARLLSRAGESSVRIILIGDGPDMPKVRAFVAEHRLSNVELPGLMSKPDLYAHLASADCLVVTGRSLPVYRYGIAYNKIPDYMLSGRPIIFAVEAANDPVAEAGAGISIPGEDPEALMSAILEMRDLPRGAREEMGRRGADFADRYFDYAKTARRIEEVL
jgi:glycosyltransferase involved in cell wall biosynthesis